MFVMHFQKKLDRGWMGGVSSIQFCLDFLNFCNFAKPLSVAIRIPSCPAPESVIPSLEAVS